MSSPEPILTTSSISRKDSTISASSASSSNAPISISTYTSISTESQPSSLASVTFAHGASGSMHTPSVQYFSNGLAHFRPVITFQGNMNMKARISSFTAVAEWCCSEAFSGSTKTTQNAKQQRAKKEEIDNAQQTSPEITDHDNKEGITLAGRSMGARAAILTATTLLSPQSPAPNPPVHQSKKLILVSYPLTNTKGDKRDQILLELPSDFSILFIIGTRDTMCPLDQLAGVRKAMKAKSWLVRVESANHGMEPKPKKMMERVVEETGRVAGLWLDGKDVGEGRREARIWIDEGFEEKEGVVRWSGWVEELEEVREGEEEAGKADEVQPAEKKIRKSTSKKHVDDQPMERKPARSKTKKQIKKKASTESIPDKPNPSKRAPSQQDDAPRPHKKQRTKVTESAIPQKASAQADLSSVASRTRSRKNVD